MPPDTLAEAITRYMDRHPSTDGFCSTELEAMAFSRSDRPTSPLPTLYRVALLCIVVQGAKRVMLGTEAFDYDSMQYVAPCMDLPMVANVTRATAREPFLALKLELDIDILRELIDQLDGPPDLKPDDPPTSADPPLGLFVGNLQAPAVDCILRLVRLLETPKAIPVLHPLIVREMYYWLLTGPDGPAIRRLATRSARAKRIAKAIRILRGDLKSPIRIERLAGIAGMSESSFHAHFKALTTLSPLQYQKQLRLLEARRLILTHVANASEAAHQVGYASPSQFSREYARMFGYPPSQELGARLIGWLAIAPPASSARSIKRNLEHQTGTASAPDRRSHDQNSD
ncbi:AraC family transcriptional regulator N-terminal domain-containing protein [Pendulispora albinea]|uniref:AraC family transcriptional regulator n=1 Tax=Pendulispora albinea TaxID=2741071 RepID=A0ABZ2LSJ2_9BACT